MFLSAAGDREGGFLSNEAGSGDSTQDAVICSSKAARNLESTGRKDCSLNSDPKLGCLVNRSVVVSSTLMVGELGIVRQQT